MDEKNSCKLWEPSKDARICSRHFVDGYSSEQNPYPSINLGYDCKRRLDIISPVGSTRKRRRGTEFGNCSTDTSASITLEHETNENEDIEILMAPIPHEERVNNAMHVSMEGIQFITHIAVEAQFLLFKTLLDFVHNLAFLHILETKTLSTENKNTDLQNSSEYHSTLLTDQNCRFFTNLENITLFNSLHDYIAPHVRRRYRAVPEPTRQFLRTPKKMGPSRKISSKDEFLLTLMKLRLNLLNTDLANRFDISEATCSNVFTCWIRAMAECLRSIIYIPDQGTVNITSPKRFKPFTNMLAIIDCSEVFIETPKDLALQSATWSEYKHHNTIKFLVAVAPNSTIIFLSKFYTGRISDKKLTLDSKFLDLVPRYSTVMADKGFNLMDECTARHIYFNVPPGRRGTSQMTPADVIKTSSIAKVRILVEQVIRRIKTFRILGGELSINMLSHADDILVVCCALCNFMEPIYKD